MRRGESPTQIGGIGHLSYFGTRIIPLTPSLAYEITASALRGSKELPVALFLTYLSLCGISAEDWSCLAHRWKALLHSKEGYSSAILGTHSSVCTSQDFSAKCRPLGGSGLRDLVAMNKISKPWPERSVRVLLHLLTSLVKPLGP